MHRFEQEWKNSSASTLTAYPSQNPPEILLSSEPLTPRQNAVIQMQQSQGNAAVRRMLGRSTEAVQRFSSDDHHNLDDREVSPDTGAAANDINEPLTPTLTPELFRDIEIADNGLQKAVPAQETLRRNVHILRSFTPAGAIRQPMPLRTAAYATTSGWSSDALSDIMGPVNSSIWNLYVAVNSRYMTE